MLQEVIKPVIAETTDLREAITSVFAVMGQARPEAWLDAMSEGVKKDIEQAIFTGDIKYQRFLINRHFRNQLGNATVKHNTDTLNARWCLIEDDTTDKWLHLFNVAAKCIVQNSLCGMSAPIVPAPAETIATME